MLNRIEKKIKMNFPSLIALLVGCYLALVHGQFKLLATVDHPSLSLSSCSINFAGKETISAVKLAQARLVRLQEKIVEMPSLDSTKYFYTYLDWGLNPSDQPAWMQGHWPFVIRGKVSRFLSTCFEIGGLPPTAPPGEYDILSKLLGKIGATSQIVMLDVCSSDLCYHNQVIALGLEKSLINSDGSPKSEASDTVLRYKTSITALEPSTSSFVSYTPSNFNDIINQICMIPKTNKLSYILNRYNFNSMVITMSKNLDLLHQYLEEYANQVKLSALDLTQDTSSNPQPGYPLFLRPLVSLLENLESCYESKRCLITEAEMMQAIENLIKMLSATTVRISLGFIELYDATCEITNSARLRCACPNSEEKFIKNLILPFALNGKKLIFDNFIHRVVDQSNQGKILESCYYAESEVFNMLTLECCAALIQGSDESVSYCPHALVSNYPIMVRDRESIIVKGGEIPALHTKCDTTSVSQLWPGDMVKLSSCDISVVSPLGKYQVKGTGLLDIQVKTNQILQAESPLSQRDLIFYSVIGISGFLFALLLLFVILICSQKARERILHCCCNSCNRQPRYMEPLGGLPADGSAREYELRALHIRPYVNSMK